MRGTYDSDIKSTSLVMSLKCHFENNLRKDKKEEKQHRTTK